MPKGIGYGKKALQGLGEKKKKSKKKLQGLQTGGQVKPPVKSDTSTPSPDLIQQFTNFLNKAGGAAIEKGLGVSYQDLIKLGQEQYPGTPTGSRHHQAAAKLAAEKYGFVPSQLLGLGIEGIEYAGGAPIGQDTVDDLIANFKGGVEGQMQSFNDIVPQNTAQPVAPSASIPRGQTGGALPQIAGVRIPAEDALAGPAPLPGLQTGGQYSDAQKQQYLQKGGLNPLMANDPTSVAQAEKTASYQQKQKKTPQQLQAEADIQRRQAKAGGAGRGGGGGGFATQTGAVGNAGDSPSQAAAAARNRPGAGSRGGVNKVGDVGGEWVTFMNESVKNGTPVTLADLRQRGYKGSPSGVAGITNGSHVNGGGGAGGGSGGPGGPGSGAVGGFNPFGGSGLGADAAKGLSGLLSTGNRSDTTAIKDSNNALAQENFAQQAGGINEQAGMLGLGSSSARAREIGGASANLNAQLNQSNSQLDFGADEAASNRMLGAQNPFLQGTGQTLSGNIANQGNDTQRFGITTGANTAAKGFTSNEKISAGNNATTMGINDKNIAAGAAGQVSDQNFKTEYFNASNPVGTGSNGGNPYGVGGFQTGGVVPRSSNNTGGREDFIDIAAQAAYGKLFNKDRVAFNQLKPQGSSSGGGGFSGVGIGRSHGSGRSEEEKSAQLRNRLMEEQLRSIQNQPKYGRPKSDNYTGPIYNPYGAPTGPISNPSDPRAVAASYYSLLNASRAAGGLKNGGTGGGDSRFAQPGRATGGRVPGSSAGGDTVPAEVGPADGRADVMLQGQEGIVPLDVMSELEGFQGDPGHAVQIINTLRDIMGQAPGPRGPEENAQGNNGRQVGGSVRSDIPVPAWRQTYQPPQQSLPVDRQRASQFGGGTPGINTRFGGGDILGDAQFSTSANTGNAQFSLQGNPNAPPQSSGQVSVNGVDQSSQLSSDQLQSAQFKRRAAFFEELMATTPQYAQERLAKRRDDALGQASMHDELSNAELNRQSVEQTQFIQSQGRVAEAQTLAGAQGGQGGQGGPQITDQQLRTTITQAAESYSKLVANGQDPGTTREEYMHGYLVELGLGQYSPYADQVGRGAQQSFIQGLASDERPKGANAEGPLFGRTSGVGAFADQTVREIPGAIGMRAGQVGDLGADGARIVDNLIGGIEQNPAEFQALLKGLGEGKLNPDELDQVIQLNTWFVGDEDKGILGQVDKMRQEGNVEGAARAAEISRLISERLNVLNINPTGATDRSTNLQYGVIDRRNDANDISTLPRRTR